MKQADQPNCWMPGRRAVLGIGLGLAPLFAAASRADEPAEMPPQPGDQLVFLSGPKKGQVIKAADLKIGGPQVQAYPIEPKSGVVRDGSRLNLLLVAHFEPAALSDETRRHSADGVVAYSGVCTHQGCPVNMWSEDLSAFFCSCHGSVYNPKNGAEVLAGPAPRPLPALPLRLEDGVPIVSASFSDLVGPTDT